MKIGEVLADYVKTAEAKGVQLTADGEAAALLAKFGITPTPITGGSAGAGDAGPGPVGGGGGGGGEVTKDEL
jgi:hypothetical protein